MDTQNLKQNCLQFFLILLGKRDYSTAELIDKAGDRNFEKVEIDDAISYLKSKNFINDQRIAKNLIEYYAQSKSKSWISQKAKSKKIDSSNFENAWEEYLAEHSSNEDTPSFESYQSLRLKIMQKYKVGNFDSLSPETVRKIYNYLAYRGFNPSEILEIWKNKN